MEQFVYELYSAAERLKRIAESQNLIDRLSPHTKAQLDSIKGDIDKIFEVAKRAFDEHRMED